MRLPLFLLAILSLGVVFSVNPLAPENAWFLPWISTETVSLPIFEAGHRAGLYTSTLSVLSIGLAYWLVIKKEIISFSFEKNRYLIYDSFEQLIFRPMVWVGHFTAWIDTLLDKTIDALANGQVILAQITAWLDDHIIDGVPNGLAKFSGWMGRQIPKMQSGKIQSYLIVMLVGMLLFLIGNIVWF
jgi:NADH-quinone oxidoreductase subunit L